MKCMRWFRLFFFSLILALPFHSTAQRVPWKDVPVDSLTDLTDVINKIFKKNTKEKEQERKKNRVQVSVFPAIGYTLQTGFAVVVSANALFYSRNPKDSNRLPTSINGSISYSQNNQIIAPFQAYIYLNNNKTILISDFRFLKYPSYTYGLGMSSSPEDATLLDYKYLKLHQYVAFEVHPHIFVGGGYLMDYYWDLRQVNEIPGHPTDFQLYGDSGRSFSSGVAASFIYATRDNPINAYKGMYANVLLSPRFKALGSDASWTSLLVDIRKYVRFPASSPNILAFWSYNWLTLSGTPPYMMLPSTAWDRNFNTGRGYIQGRFKSNNMIDLEMEYRVQLTRNGLFGAVAFCNFENFSNINTWVFPEFAPAGGIGLRIKLNKFSRTNIAIDYGWGRQGSHGFFINLGEAW